MFFPRGTMALAHGTNDHAPPVPRAAAVCALLEAELLRRADAAAGVSPGGVSALDATLADLAGRARVCVPLVIDLTGRHGLWTDLNLSAAGDCTTSTGTGIGSADSPPT